MSFRNFNSGLQQDFSTNELKYGSYLSSSEFRSQTPSSVHSTPTEVSVIPCVLFGNTLRALFFKNGDFFCYGEIILSIRGDLQDASSGFGRLGQKPAGAINLLRSRGTRERFLVSFHRRLKPNSFRLMLHVLAFSKLAEIPGSNRSYLVTDHDWRYKEFLVRAKNSLGGGFPSEIVGRCITGAKRNYKDHHLPKTDPVIMYISIFFQHYNPRNGGYDLVQAFCNIKFTVSYSFTLSTGCRTYETSFILI